MISNKSKTYLLPLLSEFVDFDTKFYRFMKQTYIEFNDSRYKNCIGVLQDFSFKNPEFTAYEHRLIKNELFVKLIDINNQVLYIFKFPEVYLPEFELFKEGKFSHFGTDAKELILEFFGEIYNGNMGAVPFLVKLKQVLFKDNKLKKQIEEKLNVRIGPDAELAEGPDLDREIFHIEKEIKNKKILDK